MDPAESTSVLGCISADGIALPPLVVFTGKAVQPGWAPEDGFPGTMYAATDNGWMVECTFYDWQTKMFTPCD